MSDETALRRDLHSHSQSSSPTRLRGRRIIGPMNSEWKVSCSVWNGGAPPWPRGRGRGSVDQICDWAPRDPPTARKIWAQFSNSSRSREAPHTLACGPDARARAHRNLNVPECESTILYQATIFLRTRVSVDAVETPGPRRGSRSVPGGTTRAPGGTRRGTIHGTACSMLPLMSHVDVPRGSSPLERIKLSTHSVSSMSTLPLLGPRQLSEDLKQARGPHASTDAHGDHRRLGSAPLAFDEHVAHLPRARHPNQWQSMAIRGISVAISDPPAESPSCQTGGQSRWRRR